MKKLCHKREHNVYRNNKQCVFSIELHLERNYRTQQYNVSWLFRCHFYRITENLHRTKKFIYQYNDDGKILIEYTYLSSLC